MIAYEWSLFDILYEISFYETPLFQTENEKRKLKENIDLESEYIYNKIKISFIFLIQIFYICLLSYL